MEAADEEDRGAPSSKRRRTVPFSRQYSDDDEPAEEEGDDDDGQLTALQTKHEVEEREEAERAIARLETICEEADVEARPHDRIGFWPSPFSSRTYLYKLLDDEGAHVVDDDDPPSHEYLKASLELSRLAADDTEQPRVIREYPKQVEAFRLQWASLSKLQRAALTEWTSKRWLPLRLPLIDEVEAAASAAHALYTTRRYARPDEFGPSQGASSADARTIQWRETKQKAPREWVVKRNPLRKEEDWLCFYCGGERDPSGKRCEKASPFCSKGCLDSYLMRIGEGNEHRRLCFHRDYGICQRCGLDCHGLYLQLKPLAPERRREVLNEAFDDGEGGSLLTKMRFESIVKSCREGSLWQADHIKAVQIGGGQVSTASALQTLCSPCHNKKTREDNAAKRAAKQQQQSGGGAPSGGGGAHEDEVVSVDEESDSVDSEDDPIG